MGREKGETLNASESAAGHGQCSTSLFEAEAIFARGWLREKTPRAAVDDHAGYHWGGFAPVAQPVAAASTISEFKVPSPGVPQGITPGPDGNLWFTYDDLTTNASAIGRATTTGTIALTPTPSASSLPTDITAGPDGAMWFTEGGGEVGRITTG